MIHIETHSHHSPVYKTLVIAFACSYNEGFPRGSVVKDLAANMGDMGSVPGWGRSPGEGNGNSVQHSCLENSKDRGAWWGAVHGVAKSQTRLTRHACMATVNKSNGCLTQYFLLRISQHHYYIPVRAKHTVSAEWWDGTSGEVVQHCTGLPRKMGDEEGSWVENR